MLLVSQVVFSPIVGILGDRIGRIRPIAFVCCALFISGNIWYSNIAAIPREVGDMNKPRVWFTLMARLIVGAGTSKWVVTAFSAG